MSRPIAILTAVLLFTSIAADDTHAIRTYEPVRRGPYVGLGVGGGVVGVTGGAALAQDVLNDLGTGGGFNLNFRVGFALSDYVTVGIESSGWAKKYDLSDSRELSVNLFFTGVAATIYPKNIGFYARGGLGVATASGRLKIPGEDDVEPEPEYGFGGLVAIGYEWRVTRKFAIGPQAEAAFLQPDGALIESGWYVSFTVQGNWYF